MTGPFRDDPFEGLPTERTRGSRRLLRDLSGLLMVLVGAIVVGLALYAIDPRAVLLAIGVALVGGGVYLGRDRDEVS